MYGIQNGQLDKLYMYMEPSQVDHLTDTKLGKQTTMLWVTRGTALKCCTCCSLFLAKKICMLR